MVETIQLAIGISVVLLRCLLLPEIIHGGAIRELLPPIQAGIVAILNLQMHVRLKAQQNIIEIPIKFEN